MDTKTKTDERAQAAQYRDNLRKRVEAARARRVAADAAYAHADQRDPRVAQNVSAEHEEARRELAQLEAALAGAEQTAAELGA